MPTSKRTIFKERTEDIVFSDIKPAFRTVLEECVVDSDRLRAIQAAQQQQQAPQRVLAAQQQQQQSQLLQLTSKKRKPLNVDEKRTKRSRKQSAQKKSYFVHHY